MRYLIDPMFDLRDTDVDKSRDKREDNVYGKMLRDHMIEPKDGAEI